MAERVLIVTTEALPDCGRPVGGGGIRSWSLGEALKARGCQVEYAFPYSLAKRLDLPDSQRRHLFNRTDLTAMVAASGADVAVFEQWYPLSFLEESPCAVAVDLPGPLILENLYRGGKAFHGSVLRKIRALAKADLFIYATPLQWSYWLPWLILAGVPHENPPLVHIPISMPQPPPQREDRGGKPLCFSYAGLFWAWADPTPALDALCRVLPEHPGAGLSIIGGRHPQHQIEGERYRDEIANYGRHPQVTFREPMPFSDLTNALAHADVGLNLETPNAERRLSSTIRAVVQLWSGLPIVVGEASWLAPLVREYDAGWVANPGDPQALHQLFKSILANPDAARARSANAQRLVSEQLDAAKTIQPLHEFCLNPVRIEKRDSFFGPVSRQIRNLMETQRRYKHLREEHLDLRRRHRALRRELSEAHRTAEGALEGLRNLQNKGLYKMYKAVGRLFGRKTD